MALELEINTAKAESSIRQIEASIGSLRASLDRFSAGGSGLDTFLNRLTTFQGINPAAISSLNSMSTAVNGLGNASSSLGKLSNALSKLAGSDISAAANAVQTFSNALKNIHVPAAMNTLINEFTVLSTRVTQATTSLTAFGAAVNNIRPPAGLSNMSQGLNNTGSSARNAASSVGNLGASFGTAASFVKGFGLSLGGLGLSKFIQDTFELTKTIERFSAQMNNLNGPQAGAQALTFLRQVSKETATDLRVLIDQYSKWSMSAQLSGKTAAESAEMFRKMSVVFRSLGLDSESTKGAFNAFVQMVQKGKISMEELRQQLGDRGVPAVNALAKSLGVSVIELDKMAEAGKLGTQAIDGLLDQLMKDFSGSLPAMLASAEAGMTRLKNAFTDVQMAFGTEYFAALASGLNMLNTAMANESTRAFASDMGQLLGIITSVAAALAGGFLMAFTLAADGVRYFTGGVLLLIGTLGTAFVVGIQAMIQTIIDLGTAMYSYIATPLSYITPLFTVLVQAMSFVGTAVMDYIITPIMQLPAVVAVIDMFRVVWETIAPPIRAVGEWIQWVWNKLTAFFAGFGKWIQSNNMLAESFSMAEFSARTFGSSMENTGMSASELAAKLQTGAQLNTGFATTADDAAAKTRNLKAAVQDTSSVFGEYRAEAEGAANAQLKLNAAAASYVPPATGGGGGGGGTVGSGTGLSSGGFGTGKHIWDSWGTGWGSGEHLWDAWSGGGLTDNGSHHKVRAPLSAFAGAPHFAGGGTTAGYQGSLPGGGIPAVLHSNEAVVPLAGGGSIPVEGGGGGPVIVPGFQKVYDCLEESKQELYVICDAINTVGNLIKVSVDFVRDEIIKVNNTLVTMIAELKKPVVSTGGGTGMTGSSSGGDVPIWQPGDAIGVTSGVANYRNAKAKMMVGSESITPAATTSIYGADAFAGTGARSRWGQAAAGLAGGVSGTPTGTSTVGTQYASKSRVFALGSPNAYKDATGGFSAILHPNEAVIPLPDGRSVPVDLSNWKPKDSSMMRNYLDEDDSSTYNRGSNEGSSKVINLHMEVVTPDAGSFRKSQDQIMQELQTKLDRATNNIGKSSSEDDPTRYIMVGKATK